MILPKLGSKPIAPRRPLAPPRVSTGTPSAGAPAPSKLPKNLLGCARMSDRRLTPIRQLVALGMLLAAVITFGLAIAGALNSVRSPVPQLASQK
jgi:hypothetical protein